MKTTAMKTTQTPTTTAPSAAPTLSATEATALRDLADAADDLALMLRRAADGRELPEERDALLVAFQNAGATPQGIVIPFGGLDTLYQTDLAEVATRVGLDGFTTWALPRLDAE